MGKVGIILEGGAMRSIFTAGILDFFLDKKIDIPNVLAVSAGAYAGMNYVSGQRGRIIEAVVEPMSNGSIFSLKHFLKTGDFFDMDLLFGKIPKETHPFDFEAFLASGKRFITSTVNCITGEAVYHDSFNNIDEFLNTCRVANSLPLLAKMGYINKVPMMDGGMVDAIPIDYALQDGWDKIVVVLTRESTYRKSAKGDIYNSKAVKYVYHKYKGLLKSIDARPQKYNESIELVEKLAKEGKVMLYRPEGITLSNNESDYDTLKSFYKVGYEYAASRYDELITFLNA